MTAWVDSEGIVVRMHGVPCGCPLAYGHHWSCDRAEPCPCVECVTVRMSRAYSATA